MKASAVILSTIIAGLIIGVVASIPVVSCLVCIWWMLAGFLAVVFYRVFSKENPFLSLGQGVLVGLIAGAISGLVGYFLGLVFGKVMLQSMMNIMATIPEFSDVYNLYASLLPAITFNFFALIRTVVIWGVFGLLGGLIGAAVFKGKGAAQVS
jgi:uncharacterized membrane protein